MTHPALPRAVVAVTGVGFVGFGLAYALAPLPMARLTDILLPTVTARIDFAATYGGLQIGFGLFLLVCARRPDWTEPGLWSATAALGGLILIRVLSLGVLDGEVTPPLWAGLALEGGAALLNWFALRRLHRLGLGLR